MTIKSLTLCLACAVVGALIVSAFTEFDEGQQGYIAGAIGYFLIILVDYAIGGKS